MVRAHSPGLAAHSFMAIVFAFADAVKAAKAVQM